MLLLSSPDTAQKFSPPIASGLRSLLAPPLGRGSGGGGGVVTRAFAAASSTRAGCGGAGVQETCDGAGITGGGGDAGSAKAEDDEEEDVGCWVSYGRREPRRRLPPPIPSLLARGALRRTRAHDGRLVIRIVPVVWAECIRARRRGGRLTMQLVERDDESPLALRPAPRTGPRDDDVVVRASDTSAPVNTGDGVDNNDAAAAAPDLGSSKAIDDAEEADVAPQDVRTVVPPPRVPSAGCFEDVFKFSSSIGGSSSMHRVPSLRMVH